MREAIERVEVHFQEAAVQHCPDDAAAFGERRNEPGVLFVGTGTGENLGQDHVDRSIALDLPVDWFEDLTVVLVDAC